MAREVKAIRMNNVLGSGINMTLVHNPKLDGPIEMYERSKDYKVVSLKIEE